MAEAKLKTEWDRMASLQYQIGLFMAKDEKAQKKISYEDFHPLRKKKVVKYRDDDGAAGFAAMKAMFTQTEKIIETRG